MKFSHSLQFNAVPDWANQYIAYSSLKSLIYKLEKERARRSTGGDVENAALLEEPQRLENVFRKALDHDLEKICNFYKLKEHELLDTEFESLKSSENEFTRELQESENEREYTRRASAASRHTRHGSEASVGFHTAGSDISDEDDNMPHEILTKTRSSTDVPRHRRNSLWEDFLHDPSNAFITDEHITLKRMAITCYVSLCELRSFAQLNRQGFTKALKKFDKTLDCSLRPVYIQQVIEKAYPFLSATQETLNRAIESVEEFYSRNNTNSDVDVARKELRLHLREHIIWERNTVWRDMIGIERKAQAAQLSGGALLLGDGITYKGRLQGDDLSVNTKALRTPVGTLYVPLWLCNTTFVLLFSSFSIFFGILYTPILENIEQQNCLALLILVSLLWATEAIPLFVTSLLVPFLVVLLRIVRSDKPGHVRLDAPAATAYIFAAMWTPVIMLLLGGFAIAAALSKYQVAKLMATWVLSKAGSRPQMVLLANMFVAMIASMWISNVAAPVLCYSVVQV